jgi:hypothetical protein
MANTDWEVGDDVLAAYTFNMRNRPNFTNGKVSKVGRRWVTFTDSNNNESDRFDRFDRRLDGRGYSSAGKVYRSLVEYSNETLLAEYSQHLKRNVVFFSTIDVTLDDLIQVFKLLNIELPRESSSV